MLYQKPVVVLNDDVAEGVFAASGTASLCDSVYRKGVYKAPDYSNWNGTPRNYDDQFGCLGCRAYTGTACGLTTHYVESGYAESYNDDNGKRMPSWEAKGYKNTDIVTDWAM